MLKQTTQFIGFYNAYTTTLLIKRKIKVSLTFSKNAIAAPNSEGDQASRSSKS